MRRRLLFVTLSNIGDLVLTTPALAALHAAYPEHLIDIVADPRSSELLTRCPYLGRLHHRVKAAGNAGLLALIKTLRGAYFEAIVDLRTDFLPWFLRGKRRSARWQSRPPGPHAVEQHFAVAARILPGPTAVPAAALWLGEPEQRVAGERLQGLPGKRWLALAPGANWPGKIWPLEHYASLTAALQSEFDGVIIVGARADQDASAALAARSALPAVNLAGSTSLLEAAAILARAAAFVGNDSGLGHMAAALGVPTLTLFGPGDPARYRPWSTKATILIAPELNLEGLSPTAVAAALRAHLAGSAA